MIEIESIDRKMKTQNKSLHWIFTPLRCVKTSEFKCSLQEQTMNDSKILFGSLKRNTELDGDYQSHGKDGLSY